MNTYQKEINQKIAALSKKGKLLFGALTAEALYPNYVVFSNKYQWGNSEVLQDAISLIFQYIVNDKLYSIDDFEDMIEKVDLITPDTEDFSDILTSFALDACTSAYSTLQFIMDNNDGNIFDVSTYALDTVDMYIQEKDDMNSLDPSIEIQIQNDDFMINEKKRQTDLVERLASANLKVVTDELLNGLRNKKPVIDLSLLPS